MNFNMAAQKCLSKWWQDIVLSKSYCIMGYALAFILGANCMIIAKIKNITKSCFLTSHPKIGLKSQTSLDLKYFL